MMFCLGMNYKIFNFESLYIEPSKFYKLQKTSCWLLPISGGADSVLVLNLLLGLHLQNPISRKLYVFYLDHQALEVSRLEEEKRLNILNLYIKNLKSSSLLDVQLIFLKRDVLRCSRLLKKSFERTGSLLRRKFINMYIRKFSIEVVFGGHTLSDWYETLIMRLNRGTSPSALYPYSPLEKKDKTFWVYFLCFLSRLEVRKLCVKMNFSYWDDPSNILPIARRNTIRQEVPIIDVAGLRKTAKNFCSDKKIYENEKEKKHQSEILPLLHIQKEHQEYWFPFYQYQACNDDEKKEILHFILKKIGLYPLSFPLQQRVHKLPFVYGVYSIELENWSNLIYLVFRRGRKTIFEFENKKRYFLNLGLTQDANRVTKKDKILFSYGHKSVKKIFSEMRLSKRQRQYIFLSFAKKNEVPIVTKISLELFGLKNLYSV